MHTTKVFLCCTVLIGATAVAGCGSSTTKSISQTVARNAVAVGAKKEFSDHGHSLKGLPTCRTAPVPGSDTRVAVTCSGRTTKGEKALLLGRTEGSNELKGTFAGTVNGVKLFTTKCIGC